MDTTIRVCKRHEHNLRLAHAIHQQEMFHRISYIPLASSELEGLGNGRVDGGVPRVLGGEGERVVVLLLSTARGELSGGCGGCCGCASPGAADFMVDQIPVMFALCLAHQHVSWDTFKTVSATSGLLCNHELMRSPIGKLSARLEQSLEWLSGSGRIRLPAPLHPLCVSVPLSEVLV